MSTDIVTTPDTMANKIDAALFRNDLSKLSDEERVVHVHNVCKTLGLNPATGPLAYIMLSGRLTLYAKRDACDQLRKLHGISIRVVSYTTSDSGLLTVHVTAEDQHGRQDEDFGVVSVKGLSGEAAANAFLKCVTKAKRRVTLSIAGLGFIDETEVEDALAATPSFGHGSIRAQPLTSESLPPPPKYPPAGKTYEQATREDLDRAPIEKPAEPADAVKPFAVPLQGDDWAGWCNTLISFVRNAPDADVINEWTTENFDNMAALQKADAAKATKLVDIVNHEIAKRIRE